MRSRTTTFEAMDEPEVELHGLTRLRRRARAGPSAERERGDHAACASPSRASRDRDDHQGEGAPASCTGAVTACCGLAGRPAGRAVCALTRRSEVTRASTSSSSGSAAGCRAPRPPPRTSRARQVPFVPRWGSNHVGKQWRTHGETKVAPHHPASPWPPSRPAATRVRAPTTRVGLATLQGEVAQGSSPPPVTRSSSSRNYTGWFGDPERRTSCSYRGSASPGSIRRIPQSSSLSAARGSAHRFRDRRRADERALAWGFSPRATSAPTTIDDIPAR